MESYRRFGRDALHAAGGSNQGGKAAGVLSLEDRREVADIHEAGPLVAQMWHTRLKWGLLGLNYCQGSERKRADLDIGSGLFFDF